MAERKETGAGMRRMSEIVVVLLVSLAAGLLAAMLVGMGAAALTVRGSVRVTQLTGAALGALFLAGLMAGLLCLRKMGRKSVLLWGVCGSGTVSAAALLCGCLLYGLPEPATLLSRLFAPLLGGALAGVLSAARK